MMRFMRGRARNPRSRVTFAEYGSASASADVTVSCSAAKLNSPSTARPALVPPTGTPRRASAFSVACTGVSFQNRT